MRALCLLFCLAAGCRQAESPPPAPQVAVARIDGTTWTFCPDARTSSCIESASPGLTEKVCFVQAPFQGTVTFHPGGVAEILGVDRQPQCNPSSWTQSGDRVVFDCNQVTTYEVQVHGDAMSGEWRRVATPIVQPRTLVPAPVMPMIGTMFPAGQGHACLARAVERPFAPPDVEGTTWRACLGTRAQALGFSVTFQPGGVASFEREVMQHRAPYACENAHWSQARERVTFDCSLLSYDLRFVDGGVRLLGEMVDALRPGKGNTACFERVGPGGSSLASP